MKIEDAIKTRCTIRNYKKRHVPMSTINKILDAARWAPSVHNSQPWRFIVIRDKNLIGKIGKMLITKAHDLLAGFNIVLKETGFIIAKAPIVIIVYDTCELSNRIKKFGEPYFSIMENSALQSISAAIQNILLMATSQRIGVAWLSSPLFCGEEVMSLLKVNGSAVAILTLGYPVGDSKALPKKALCDLVEYR